jgi:hypothetical protein
MIVIQPQKIKSKSGTIQMFLAHQEEFKTFYRDVRANSRIILAISRYSCVNSWFRRLMLSSYRPSSLVFFSLLDYIRRIVTIQQ